MCQGWDPAWAYMVPCHDWPPASSGGRATPGVLAVESLQTAAGQLSCSLWYGCCLPAQGIGSVCILCPPETICHHGKSKNCISGQTWRHLADRACSDVSSITPQSLSGPWVWQCHCPGWHHQSGPRPCSMPLLAQAQAQASRTSSAMAPRGVSPAHRSAANEKPSRQASPCPIGQQGWAGPPECSRC